MQKRILYTDRHLKLIAALKKDNKLSMYIFLCTAKYRNFGKPNFEKKDLKNIGYSTEMVNTYVRLLKQCGWAIEISNKRYIFTSPHKIASSYDVKLHANRGNTFLGDSIKEAVARAASLYVSRNILKQHNKVHGNMTRKKKAMLVQSFDQNVTFSVRRLIKLIGYSSAMSGTNYFRFMKKENLIDREHQYEYIGNISQVGDVRKYTDNVNSIYVDRSGDMYLRKACLVKIINK